MNSPLIEQTVQRLRRRLAEVEAVLAILEAELLQPKRKRSNRGRKSMGVEERIEVSARMKRYWSSKGGS